jgi:hypothetical protein
MRGIEDSIKQLIRRKFAGERPTGLITAWSSDGSVAHIGTIELGSISRKEIDVVEAFFSGNNDQKLGSLLQELCDSSQSAPDGPWYHCEIRVYPDWNIEFEYFWERTPFNSIEELQKDVHGSIPSFVFKTRFDETLIAEMSDFDINRGIIYYVANEHSAGRSVSRSLLELFATTDWQGDVNNGAMNQYFARRNEMEIGMPRSDLYPLVHAGLLRIGATEAAAIFSESLALYSHYYPEVDVARSNLGVAALPMQEESDIMDRYYDVAPQLDSLRAAYLRKFGPGSLSAAA